MLRKFVLSCFYIYFKIFYSLQPKSIIEHIKKALSSSNSQVRGSAVSLLGTIYLYMGSQLGMLLENEKPAILTIINKEFQKVNVYYILIIKRKSSLTDLSFRSLMLPFTPSLKCLIIKMKQFLNAAI